MPNSKSRKLTIHIEALTFTAIIGLLDFERIQNQQIQVDAKIHYLYDYNNFINYADVVQTIEKLIIEKKYILLEDALLDIEENLLSIYPQIIEFELKISKPEIINNATVALSLHIFNSKR